MGSNQGSLEYVIIIGGIIIVAAATYFMLRGFAQTTGEGTTETIGVAGDKFRLELENLGRAENKFFAKKWGSFPQVSILTLSNTGTATTAEITLNNLTDYGLVLDEIEFAYNYSGAIETLDYTIEQPSNPDSQVTFTSPTLPEGTPTVPSYTGILIFHNNSGADELDNFDYISSDPDVNVTEDGGTSPVQSPDIDSPSIVISATAFGVSGSVKDADIQVTVTDADSSIIEVRYSMENSPYFKADNLYYGFQDIVLEGHPEDYSYGSNSETIHIIATVPSEDNYTVRVRAVDEYSNERVETQNVSIVLGTPPGDSTPPVIIDSVPENNTLVNDSILALNLTSNEDAECRYGGVGGLMFSAMNPMDLSGYTFHQHNFTLADGENYTYYFKCNDTAGNLNYTDYVINFTKSMPPVDNPPAILSTQPANNTLVNVSLLTINITTNEIAHCRFSNQSGTPYSSMTDFTNTDSTNHNITNIALDYDQNYKYYFKCNDTSGNVNPSDYLLNFSTESAVIYSWPMFRFNPVHTANPNFASQVLISTAIWPVFTGDYIYSSPSIADLDGNPSNGLEVIIGSGDFNIYAFHANGSNVSGWPILTGGEVDSSPAIADLDGNPSNGLEVVVGSQDFNVYALHANGSNVSGWPTNVRGYVQSSPAIVDLDGNPSNGLEVIIGSDDNNVYALHANGSNVSGWPIPTGDRVYSSPTIADLDANPSNGLEVVIGSYDDYVYAFHANGSNVSGWPILTTGDVYSSPAIADLDGNPTNGLEVVVGSRGDYVHAFHANGSNVSGWPISIQNYVDPSPAIADLDGNPTNGLEVIIGSDDNNVYALHANGSNVSGWPIPTGDDVISSPAIADLDNNPSNGLEVVVGSQDFNVYAFHANGSNLSGWPILTTDIVDTSPAITDLDGNISNGLEVVVGNYDGRVYVWHADGTPFN